MIFKNYRTRLILYILAITIMIAGFFYVLYYHDILLLNLVIFILLIFLIVNMIRFVERINTKLTTLFESIQYSDFSISFRDNLTGSGFDELYNSLNKVVEKFKEERKERIGHYNYMKTIVQHIKVGLIAFDRDGNIQLMNLAFRKLFNIKKFNNLAQLENRHIELFEALKNINSFDSETVQLNIDGKPMNLAIAATRFVLHQKKYKLISINDIKSELEKTEMDAWEDLISVITHEIMNSITPISSLASTVNRTLQDAEQIGANLSDEDIEDITLASKTIEKRSARLLKFVKKYRQVTKIPKPELEKIYIKNIYNEIIPIIEKNEQIKSVDFEYRINPEELEIYADQTLLEQVIINLINNSLQSLKDVEKGKLKLISKFDKDSRVLIEVIDNGPGIPQDYLKKIFIPFFTTKKEGSGIGLSLSRQIMRAHNGRLLVNSIPHEKTVFTLEF